jgi:hypothetical protein
MTFINKITNRRRIHSSAKDWAGGSMKVPATRVTNKKRQRRTQLTAKKNPDA